MSKNNRKAELEKALAYAAFFEGRKLAPLHAALLEAVEALEILNSQLRPIGRYSDQAESALAKIDEAIEGMGGK